MQVTLRAASLALAAAGFSVIGGARAEDVVVLEGSSATGLLMRSDGPRTPHVLYGTVLKGLEEGERVRAIDTRPSNGILYGLTARRLVAIDLITGEAVPVGPRFTDSVAVAPYRPVGFDFDPSMPLARLLEPLYGPGAAGPLEATVSTSIDAESGALVGQAARPPVAYVLGDEAEGTVPQIGALAIAADVGGPASWTEFGIDTARGTLVRLGDAGGVLSGAGDRNAVTTIATITGLAPGSVAYGLEIGRTGVGHVLGQGLNGDPLDTGLYDLDLGTGEATLVWDIGQSLALDVAVLPNAVPAAMQTLQVSKASLRFDFRSSHRDSDVIALSGTMPMPQGDLAGRTVQIDIDGISRSFELGARHRGTAGPDLFRFLGKPSGGLIRWSLTLRRGEFRAAGIDRSTPSGPRTMTIDVFIDGRVSRATVPLSYVARGGRGVAR